ncbi:hypothetical protein [Nocardia sp. NPDC051981]|uniref:hypothetical protein n=1 Tax=Nocardia sp. NPDC051981 TaxID=3155417 RepID=UPI00341C7C9A
MDFGAASSAGLQPAIHIVDGFAAEQHRAEGEDLGGRPVVDRQPPRASADVDSGIAQADSIVVDALMGIATMEQSSAPTATAAPRSPSEAFAKSARHAVTDIHGQDTQSRIRCRRKSILLGHTFVV